ncbi:MAG: alpha-E domain-containing protein [Pseudomonadota bacterium]|nr:alpha-E domain-containing protein [Pseudomonadota bacterium]
MLSRSAQNLYWLGRYLQRAEHVCSMLKLQVATIADRPHREVHCGWSLIYNSLGRRPPLEHATAEPYDDDDLMFADAYILADDLTFEADNHNSIYNCIACGRENARQSRNCITFAMWACLNRFWLQLKGKDLAKVWQPIPESYYDDMLGRLESFIGTTITTMYRNQAWHFLHLGRILEQAQQTSSLLLAQQRLHDYRYGWVGLLRVFHATSVYHRLYPGKVMAFEITKLLVHDPALPYSLQSLYLRLKDKIAILTTATGDSPELTAMLAQLEVNDPAKNAELNLASYREHLFNLDRLIAKRWFFYSVDEE